MIHSLFFELILVALGRQTALSKVPTEAEWRRLLEQARKQTLVGVCFSGIEKLPAEQRPPKELIMQWFALTRQIEERNRLMDQRTAFATKYFRESGFLTWVLKGQGIARLYRLEVKSPSPTLPVGARDLKSGGSNPSIDLRLRRQSGDIDVWLKPLSGSPRGGEGIEFCDERLNVESRESNAKRKNGDVRQRIYEFAKRNDAEGKLHGVNYHHVHYHLFDDAEVEVHIYPGYLHNPFLNRRLHSFFETYPPTDESTTPSLTFNLVYILLHIYNHLLGHGVGLRQVMDYYFVLRTQNGRWNMDDGRCEAGAVEKEYEEARKWIEKLGMRRVAGAVMWVMQEVFGLEKEYMLYEPDEKEGRFLLQEICQTGNMGHYDQRHWGSLNTPVSRFFYNLRRDWHLISHYPQEVIWQPLFSIWMNVMRYFWTRK